MIYIVTFNITTPQPYSDTVETVTRKFPQYLSGVQMTQFMFCELMLADFPMSRVEVITVEKQQ